MADGVITLFDDGINTTAAILKLPQDLTFDQWQAAGVRLFKGHSRLQWLIGDWWIYGQDRYDSRRYSIPDEWGIDYRTCENYASVCRAFSDISRRREDLSFGHHAAVAALSPEKADELLAWCVENAAANGPPSARWELRNKVKRITPPIVRVSRFDIMPPPIGQSPGHHPVGRSLQAAQDALDTAIDGLKKPPAAPRRLSEPLLDESTGGPVPPELAALTLEPPPPPDKVAIAHAVLADLLFPELLEVITEVVSTLPPDQREKIARAIAAAATR